MTQYMLLLRGGGDYWATRTPDELREAYQKYYDWSSKLARENSSRDSNELKPDGRVMRRTDQGIVDGPYAETKEGVGGYFIIEAAGYDQAVEIARGCPIFHHNGFVEVRECVDHPAA